MDMAGAHTKDFLNKISKYDFGQFILNTEVNLGSKISKLTTQVKDILAHSKKSEEDVATVSYVNNKYVEKVVATECHCWRNVQYLSRDILELVGVLISVRDNALERKTCDVFQEICVDVCDRVKCFIV